MTISTATTATTTTSMETAKTAVKTDKGTDGAAAAPTLKLRGDTSKASTGVFPDLEKKGVSIVSCYCSQSGYLAVSLFR